MKENRNKTCTAVMLLLQIPVLLEFSSCKKKSIKLLCAKLDSTIINQYVLYTYIINAWYIIQLLYKSTVELTYVFLLHITCIVKRNCQNHILNYTTKEINPDCFFNGIKIARRWMRGGREKWKGYKSIFIHITLFSTHLQNVKCLSRSNVKLDLKLVPYLSYRDLNESVVPLWKQSVPIGSYLTKWSPFTGTSSFSTIMQDVDFWLHESGSSVVSITHLQRTG